MILRVAKVVADADVIALQEVERHWLRTETTTSPKCCPGCCRTITAVYGPAFDMDASSGADGRVVNRRRQFGTMMLSRLPIVWSRLHLLPMRKVVRPLNTQNAALEGMIRTPAGPVRIFSLHLAHIGVEERLEQIAFLKARHRARSLRRRPVERCRRRAGRNWTHGEAEPEAPLAAIWMGDFNMEPGSAEYLAITGRNPIPSVGGLSRRLRRCCGRRRRRCRGRSHPCRTIRARTKRRLDHCFVGAMLAGRVRSVQVDTGCMASDHFPVYGSTSTLETPCGDG